MKKFTQALLSLVFVVVISSCQTEEINEAPTLTNKLQDLQIVSGLNSISISLVNTFTDPDGDQLTFEATSSDENIVSVSINGSLLTGVKVTRGRANITVTATDALNNTTTDSFDITVQ